MLGGSVLTTFLEKHTTGQRPPAQHHGEVFSADLCETSMREPLCPAGHLLGPGPPEEVAC